MGLQLETGLVLVLDDDPDIAESLAELLSHAGHRVRSFASGDQVLDLVRRGGVSLVLMDWDLTAAPMGVDLVRALKRTSRAVPLIVMSADTAALAVAGEAGADDYLQKPLDVDDLLSLVEELAA